MGLTLIYACGLRIFEGAHLATYDIDGKRNILTVRNSKGGKDRISTSLSGALELLQAYKADFLLMDNK